MNYNTLPIIGEGFSMSTQRQAEFPKGSKLGNSENPWYNIFRKRKGVISQEHSEKAQAATVLVYGNNRRAGAEKAKAAGDFDS